MESLKNDVESFVSQLLMNKLTCLNDSRAELYWMKKKRPAAILTSSHKQLQVYHGVSSDMMNRALLSVQSASEIVITENKSPVIRQRQHLCWKAVLLDECHDLLLRNSLRVKKTADPGLSFAFDFFMIFVTQILDKRDMLSKQESVCNYRALFRFLDAAASTTPSCTFFPGEIRLQSIHKELERLEMSTKSYYNADGVILDDDTGLELCLLETSGPFYLIDHKRETTDQVKATYGLLSMLHTIAYRFVHADIEVFKKLNVYFVHAFQDGIRLWSFSLVDKELYILNRVASATLPTTNSDQFKAECIHLVNLFWKLKMLLDGARSTLNEIKASHTKNLKAYDDGHNEQLPRLDQFLVESAEVKLSSRISQASDIYISSSPIRPDSP